MLSIEGKGCLKTPEEEVSLENYKEKHIYYGKKDLEKV